jgi:hypothetical protein
MKQKLDKNERKPSRERAAAAAAKKERKYNKEYKKNVQRLN